MRWKSTAVDKSDQDVLREGQKEMTDAEALPEYEQTPPMFFSVNRAPLYLKDTYRNTAAFLIAAGPSFASVDKTKLQGAWTMTLNNAVASYRSNANCIVDDPSRFNYSTWLDPAIQKFAPLATFKKPLWDNRLLTADGGAAQQWRQAELTVADCPNVIGYRRNESFEAGRFLDEETINWGCHAKFGGGRSVMLPALKILFLLGFRRVYLLGVDFDMSDQKKYHFPEDRPPGAIHGNMETYAKLQKWFAELQPYFLKENFVVKNCNPESKLTAFPFMPFDEAADEALGSLGAYKRERTVGMYKPLKDKLPLAETLPRGEISLGTKPPLENLAHDGANGVIHSGAVEKRDIRLLNCTGGKRRLILRNFQSPGDLVMLTAAVRDLHRSYPDQFETDVRTSTPALWEYNPYVTSLDETDPLVEVIDCSYPLIHKSNTGPWHFVHGFTEFLNETLRLSIKATDFKGDIHLGATERDWMSQVQETTLDPVPYWIIAAGGKRDFTIKWWSRERYQQVVNRFRGRILFVQVGEAGHEHHPLDGVLDLRGKTDLRQLVRLVHHSQGVLCSVTLLMHLAAAVETRNGMPKNRPCVVVAGGREPPQWEAYPHHQFIHTNGALLCCDNGGCWKSRIYPLNDGDEKDKEENLCIDVVLSKGNRDPALRDGHKTNGSFERKTAHKFSQDEWKRLLPSVVCLK